MSAEKNTEAIRKIYVAYLRRDMAALFEALADEIQWITPGNSELSGERRGKDEIAGFFRTLEEQWEMLSFEPHEYIASGDRVIATGRYEFRARSTGRAAASHWAMAWTLRNGKVTHFQEYTDTSRLEEALTAVQRQSV